MTMNLKRVLCLALTALLLVCAAYALGEHEKVVYLTFDDGPRASTPNLLAALEALDVKATFFFVGAKVDRFPEEAKMVLEAGHTVGCHTYYHNGVDGITDITSFRYDFAHFLRIMREKVDPDFDTKLFRFPGGSTSYRMSFRKAIAEEGIAWFDWSALTGDTYEDITSRKVLENVRKTSYGEDVVLLLAHDGKKVTLDALEELVTDFRERGFEFRTLSLSETDREILSRCTANMMFPEIKTEEN